MRIKHIAVLAAGLMLSTTASSQTIKEIPLTASQNPTGADRPVSQAVWAGDTLYISGWLDPDLATHHDTHAQAVGILQDVQKFLKTQNLTLGDVVMIREYTGPDKQGKYDISGTRAALNEFFGTKEQPGKPASTGVYSLLLAGDRGALVELDFIAVRPKPSSGS
jgi:enamine deaminase RidA (YjgF/YER057c/UK114 family)